MFYFASSMVVEQASPWLRRFSEDHAVVLGSSSQWRRKVFSQASCRLAGAMDPDIDEKAIRNDNPDTLVLDISNAKADAVLAKMDTQMLQNPCAFLVCTDQVAVCEGKIREKPESEAQARQFISSYSEGGKSVDTCSGVVVVHVASGRRAQGTYWNSVWYNPIPASAVDEIVNGNVVYTCCGGFSVDCALMGKFVSRIEGEFAGVMGMPLGLLETLFKELID